MKQRKKTLALPALFLGVCLAVISIPRYGYPAEKAEEKMVPAIDHFDSAKMGEKLGRGVENVFVGWLEIPYQIRITSREKGAFQGAAVGFGKGLGMTAARMLVGVYEVVTFPYAQEPILTPTEDWQWEVSKP